MSHNRKFEPPVHICNNVNIRPNYFVITPQFSGSRKKRSLLQLENESNLKDNRHKQKLSPKASSNLRTSINWLLHSAKMKRVYVKRDNKAFWFKVNFVTLTIPPQNNSIVNEKVFQSVLNTFFAYARKYYYLSNYVWKVEAHEDKRLHIHITTDTFINHKHLKDSWNRILQKRGLLASHFEKFGNYSPNSTDVHAVHKVNNVAAYLCEYMVKKPNFPEEFKGRIWGCSYSLSASNVCKVELDKSYNRRDYSFLNNPVIRYKAVQSKPDSMGVTKVIADMYLLNEWDWDKHMTGLIKDAYKERLAEIREGTKVSPEGYRQIDFLKFKKVVEISEIKKESINLAKCGTSCYIQKTGSIQLDLIF